MATISNGKWLGLLGVAYSLVWLVSSEGGTYMARDNASKDWRHSEPVAAQFFREGDRVCLYTLDYSGEAIVKWDLPSMRVLEIHRPKFSEPFADFLRLWLSPRFLIIQADSKRFLVDRQKSTHAIPILHPIGDISVLDERCFVVWLEYPGSPALSMSGFVYRTDDSGAPELVKQVSFELPARRVLYRAPGSDGVKCLYIGLNAEEIPLVKDTASQDKLKSEGPLTVATVDIVKGKIVMVKNLGIHSGATVAAHNSKFNEIMVSSAVDNVIVLSAEDLRVKDKLNWSLSFPERRKGEDGGFVDLATFAPNGQYLAYTDMLGEVAVRQWPTGKLVLYDNNHKLLIDKYCKNITARDPSNVLRAALSAALMSVRHIAFVDNRLLAVVTGSGHVYLYDIEKGQRLQTHLVCRKDFLQE